MAEKKTVDTSIDGSVKETPSSDHEQASDFVEGPNWKGNNVKKEVRDGPIRKIRVTKLPEGTTEAMLRNYFENRRRNSGGPIETIEYHPATSSAIIEFQEADAVDRVLKKRPLIFLMKLISVEEYAEEMEEGPLCRTIEVHGLNEMLEMYFKNSKQSGGGEVTTVEIEDGVAHITFKDEDVARRVAEREHAVAGCTLDVKLCKLLKCKSARNMFRKCSKEPEESIPHCTIEVRGVTKNLNFTTLHLYFENKKRSGGDEIVKFEHIEENEIAYITYESEEVAQRVASHGHHKVEGQPLKVKLYIPPPPRRTYEDRVLLAGLTSKITREGLTNFLEAKIGLTPANFLYGDERDKVIITFDENIDFQKLEEACRKRVLEGSHLQPSKVNVSNCILVLNLKITTTEDTIELYFENEKRSWGGTVEKVEFNREEQYCLVYFEDHTICEQVLQRKHKIDGSELQVSMYYECLGHISKNDTGPCFKPPKPVKLEAFEFEKMPFQLKSERNRPSQEKKLQDSFTQFQWPQAQTDCTTLTCTLTSHVEGVKKKEQDEPIRKIRVTKLPERTTEETLMNYFENGRRSGGGPIENIKYHPATSSAIIEFQEADAVERVLKKVPLLFLKKEISVEEYAEEEEEEEPSCCTIEVRGFADNTQETDLEMYFENTKRSGGRDVTSVVIEGGIALVTFADENIAKRVAERKHVVAGCTLDLKLYIPPKRKSVRNLSRTTSKEPEESVPCSTIEVRGVTSKILNSVQLFFENKKRSGGEEIVNFDYQEENEIVYITYESEEVAQRVVSHGQHKVEGQSLEVKLYKPPPPRPTYEDRVLLAGFTSKVTQDQLTNFLEAKTGRTPDKFLYSKDKGKVIITFEETIDFEKLEESCKKRPLDGSYLQPFKVNISNCIIIFNLKITTTEDMIELYFENEKRSWGGPVEKVEFKREEEYCLVFFEDHAICEQVLQRKHKLDGSELQYSMYYECLGCISKDDMDLPSRSPSQ